MRWFDQPFNKSIFVILVGLSIVGATLLFTLIMEMLK